MDLNTLWFILIGVLFVGFFILEGFDYGVGILLPFLGKNDTERRRIINTIGPVWDGNEVWLLTAGGAIFAAFPHWYATLFSGFYLALFLMLAALIVRGVAFEFRSKDRSPAWRATWDWMIFAGSAVPALLWGVALGNMLKGVPIDADQDLRRRVLQPAEPVRARARADDALAAFITHGAIFLHLKSTDPIKARALGATKKVGPAATVLVVAVRGRHLRLDRRLHAARHQPGPRRRSSRSSRCWRRARSCAADSMGWAFGMTCLAHRACDGHDLHGALSARHGLQPDPEWSLTIYNASSTPYTLRVMSIVAVHLRAARAGSTRGGPTGSSATGSVPRPSSSTRPRSCSRRGPDGGCRQQSPSGRWPGPSPCSS